MKKPLSKRHELIARLPYVLLKLLIERKALSTYVEATLSSIKEDVISIAAIFRIKKEEILVVSFFWRNNKKGYYFWNSLNVEYNERLSRNGEL